MPIQISKQFKELNNEHSYLIVTGRQVAKFYELRKGKILKKPTVEVQPPEYTDQEGTRRREGDRGGNYGTASDYQTKDDGRQTYFLKDVRKESKDLAKDKDIDAIYLFSPREIIEHIKENFPQSWQKKIKLEYKGNFTKSHPDELLEKIRSRREKEERKKIPTSKEADHILKETSKRTLAEMNIGRK